MKTLREIDVYIAVSSEYKLNMKSNLKDSILKKKSKKKLSIMQFDNAIVKQQLIILKKNFQNYLMKKKIKKKAKKTKLNDFIESAKTNIDEKIKIALFFCIICITLNLIIFRI